MKILTQLAIIFTICLVAECIAAVLPFTFPSGVIGMILLFLLLLFKFIKRRHIEEVSQFVLKNISFFYIPTAVSIMESVGYLQGYVAVCIDLYCFGIAYFFGNSIYRNWCYETSGKNYGE